MRSRGFLLGGTAGRTTLNGEGLQHEDGSSQVAASFVPNCVSYDPTYAYEVAVIIQDGLRRMLDRAGRRLLLHHADERELPASGDAARRRARASCAACICCATPATGQGQDAARAAASVRARSCARSRRRPNCSPTNGTSRRRVERDELQRARSATASPRSAGTCCTRKRSRGSRYVEECLRGPRGARHRRDRLHPDVRRADPAVRRDAPATSRSEPTATAAATSGASCASSSKSIATASRSPRCERSPTKARIARSDVEQGDREVRHRSQQAQSDDGVSR